MRKTLIFGSVCLGVGLGALGGMSGASAANLPPNHTLTAKGVIYQDLSAISKKFSNFHLPMIIQIYRSRNSRYFINIGGRGVNAGGFIFSGSGTKQKTVRIKSMYTKKDIIKKRKNCYKTFPKTPKGLKGMNFDAKEFCKTINPMSMTNATMQKDRVSFNDYGNRVVVELEMSPASPSKLKFDIGLNGLSCNVRNFSATATALKRVTIKGCRITAGNAMKR